MSNGSFKYDVAFSFLKEDENLAIQINDLIQDRLNTFLYSKRQEDIAGTDGEKSFSDVFGKQSRCTVVLYRETWGTTPWTRIEETAIRNRAFEEGYDFSLFIPMNNPPTVPRYLPRTQLWVGLDRWGIKGAAAVIEARVQDLGGEPKEETPTDIASRISRDRQYENERSMLLSSEKGLELASKEFIRLYTELENCKKSIEESNKGFSFGFYPKTASCTVIFGNFTIRFSWQTVYRNTLEDSVLHFTLQEPTREYKDPHILTKYHYHFDISKTGEYGWIKGLDRDSFISSKRLAEESIKLLLTHVEKERDIERGQKYI